MIDLNWTRFRVHAKRVRSLRADYVDLSDTLIPEIRRLQLAPESIFPILTTIHWSDPLTWPQVAHFITPTLRNLAIELGHMVTNQIHFDSLMVLIPKVAENLTELDVTAYRMDYDSFVALASMTTQLSKIQALAVHLPDIEASEFLTTVSAIPTLKRLHLRGSFGLRAGWSGVTMPPPFRALEEISLQNVHALQEIEKWKGLAQIFEATAPNGVLRTITLDECVGGPCTGIQSLTRAIALHPQLQTFRIFPISDARFIDFVPLKACTSLTSLEIVTFRNLYITVAELANMVQSLASLQRLTVAFSRARGAPTVPLGAVGVVASLCPSIEYIELTVDATQPNVPPSSASTTPSLSVQVVEVGHVQVCSIDDPREVVRYLASLSVNPNFRVGHRHHSYGDDRGIYARRWAKVLGLVAGPPCVRCEVME